MLGLKDVETLKLKQRSKSPTMAHHHLTVNSCHSLEHLFTFVYPKSSDQSVDSFGMIRPTGIYACNVPVSTYFWSCISSDRLPK